MCTLVIAEVLRNVGYCIQVRSCMRLGRQQNTNFQAIGIFLDKLRSGTLYLMCKDLHYHCILRLFVRKEAYNHWHFDMKVAHYHRIRPNHKKVLDSWMEH